MIMDMKAAILRWTSNNKEDKTGKQHQCMSAKRWNNIRQDGTITMSLRISKDAESMMQVESYNRTPSPATISRRKRGPRGSLFGKTGSLPLGGVRISTAYSDGCNSQDGQEPESIRSSLVLDPVEHAWMIMAAEGKFDELQESLQQDPSLVYKKDFVTGYSILHWMAKHGNHEDLIKLMDFAGAREYKIDINACASGGLTPLHIAAIQGHGMLIKVLVGAYSADINARDHNGRKAWQYLKHHTPRPLLELLGAPEEDESDALIVMNINNNCLPSDCQGRVQHRYDEMDSASKLTLTVSPLTNLFRNAYSFFKKW
ncbi:ankyrin repeat domain-containing protein SOWAHD isoform X2 [Bombina bombina]|uniref:ankyrin repeat domain-containing protein SOWAHD isoform X2 n=1 Tax=Bombina bombina TaxID=8345 RepID=UPI00235A8074|nr:ankyrin repeat domain-containing protein SOWAHD isoform X2 [Bombina bombina]XP_053555167.1 ankyrin repeat domain-containing protein SOWAHD isoform X2 [Bombina bombina]XP_053555168.1 ankyrin repeat domain-containing protein SOWAHD isoform X2 [Bombina bombina]XP_053555169.1 ankyrin repeat domain-containing protein SOWAHD isoform X2 [Bombina bombina]